MNVIELFVEGYASTRCGANGLLHWWVNAFRIAVPPSPPMLLLPRLMLVIVELFSGALANATAPSDPMALSGCSQPGTRRSRLTLK